MKVLTCKSLLLCLALTPAHPVMAGGWFDYCLPAWIATPVSWIKNYVAPHMPASISDANRIKKPIEESISAAQSLLKASQEVHNKEIFPRCGALRDDLEWLDRNLRATQSEHTAFLTQQENDIDELKKNEEAFSLDLKNTTIHALALNEQFAKADLSIGNMKATLALQHENTNKALAAFRIAFEQKSAETTALVEQCGNAFNDFDSKIESDVISMNRKVTAGRVTLNDLIATNESNQNKIASLNQEMQKMLLKMDRLIEAKKKRRKQKASSVILQQAVLNLGKA